MTFAYQCNACGALYFDVQRDGTLYYHACAPLPPDKNGFAAERLNKRDENLARVRPGVIPGIISEGDGVTSLKNPQFSEPQWITAQKAAIAKQEEKEGA